MAADLTQVSILARREIEARILNPVIRAFVKELGQERTLKIIESIIKSLAKESGEEIAKVMEGNSLAHFAQSLSFWTTEDALQIKVLEESRQRYCFDVTRCRYAEMYKELGITELGVLLSCNRDYAFIDGFNPKIRLTRSKTIMEGADICDFRYEFKDE
jgi:hypothetical protein